MSDDIELMRLAAQGNTMAIGGLYDRHAPIIYSVLMQQLEDPAEAQDILHDVFVKVHTKSATYDPAYGKPIAWLLTIARNKATDRLRRRTTHLKYVTRLSPEEMNPAIERTGMHSDEIEILRGCLALLDGQQREALQLAYFSGCTQQEVADNLNQPLGSVKAWIRRGLQKLKTCVEPKL